MRGPTNGKIRFFSILFHRKPNKKCMAIENDENFENVTFTWSASCSYINIIPLWPSFQFVLSVPNEKPELKTRGDMNYARLVVKSFSCVYTSKPISSIGETEPQRPLSNHWCFLFSPEGKNESKTREEGEWKERERVTVSVFHSTDARVSLFLAQLQIYSTSFFYFTPLFFRSPDLSFYCAKRGARVRRSHTDIPSIHLRYQQFSSTFSICTHITHIYEHKINRLR